MSTHRIVTPANCPIAVYAHDESGRCMDAHGFTMTTCGKCGGYGYLSGYEFSDGARCWRCNARGYYYTPKVEEARAAFLADLKAKRPTDIAAYWKAARSKVESDVADKIKAQVAEYNAKVREEQTGECTQPAMA
jgi:hypothetical protein